MTAEISVYNELGVALAADSAMTIGREKISNSATKLFTLDTGHAIGIMIFGNANLSGTPWELIINLYRQSLDTIALDTLEDYANRFLKFVNQLNMLGTDIEDKFLVNYFTDFVDALTRQLQRSVSDEMSEHLFLMALERVYQTNSHKNTLISINRESFVETYGDFLIRQVREDTGISMTSTEFDDFVDHLLLFMSGTSFSSSSTGIVFAGYGSQDVFPKVSQYLIDGFFQKQLKFREMEHIIVGNGNDETNSGLLPFAQSDMVLTVVNGIDPNMAEYQNNQLANIKKSIFDHFNFDDDGQRIVDDLFDNSLQTYQDYQRDHFTRRIVNMIQYLSISELATMAQTMISLTSFKRKFSDDIETVGGAVDVLTITKGQGPVWIKQKNDLI